MQIWVQWLELTPFPKECRIWEAYQKLVFEDGGVQKSVLPLIFGCNHLGSLQICSLLLPGKRSKSPGTRDASVGSAFVQKLPFGNILQSVASLVARVFSSVFRVLRNSFSYPHFVRITHTQTVLALNPKNSRPLDCDAYGAGWVLSYQCYGWNRINTADWNTLLYPFKLLPDTNNCFC